MTSICSHVMVRYQIHPPEVRKKTTSNMIGRTERTFLYKYKAYTASKMYLYNMGIDTYQREWDKTGHLYPRHVFLVLPYPLKQLVDVGINLGGGWHNCQSNEGGLSKLFWGGGGKSQVYVFFKKS